MGEFQARWLHLEFPWEFIDLAKKLNQRDIMEMYVCTYKGEQLKVDVSCSDVAGTNKFCMNIYRMVTEADVLPQEIPEVTIESILSPVYLSQNVAGVTAAGVTPSSDTEGNAVDETGELSTELGDGSDAAFSLIATASQPDNSDKKTDAHLEEQDPECIDNIAGVEGTESEFEVKYEPIAESSCQETPPSCDLPLRNDIQESDSALKTEAQESGLTNMTSQQTISIPDAMVLEGLSGKDMPVEVKTEDGAVLISEVVPQLTENMVLTSTSTQLQGIITHLVQNGESAVTIVTDEQDGHEGLTGEVALEQPPDIEIVCPECLEVFPTTTIGSHIQEFHPDSANCQAVIEHLFGSKIVEAVDTLQRTSEPHSTARHSTDIIKIQRKRHSVQQGSGPPLVLDLQANSTQVVVHKCYHCNQAYCNPKTLKHHVEKMHHEEFDSSRVTFQVEDTGVKCHLCDYIGRDKFKIRRHLQTVHRIEVFNPNKVFECFICQTKLAGMKQTRNHIRRNHKGHPMYEDALVKAWPAKTPKRVIQGDMPCPECLKTFPMTFLRRHLRAYHSDSPTLDDAIKIVRRKMTQKRDLLRMDQPKKCTCPKCGLVLTRPKLKGHIGNRLCRKRVLTKLVLDDPSKAHLLKKPKMQKPIPKVTCEECGQLILQTSLRIHMYSIHNKNIRKPVKLITCTYDDCDKTFIKKYNLKRHIEINHLGESGNWPCEQCGKSFTTKYGLTKHHKTIHEGQFVYQCERCLMGFSKKVRLVKHTQVFQDTGACPKPMRRRKKRQVTSIVVNQTVNNGRACGTGSVDSGVPGSISAQLACIKEEVDGDSETNVSKASLKVASRSAGKMCDSESLRLENPSGDTSRMSGSMKGPEESSTGLFPRVVLQDIGRGSSVRMGKDSDAAGKICKSKFKDVRKVDPVSVMIKEQTETDTHGQRSQSAFQARSGRIRTPKRILDL